MGLAAAGGMFVLVFIGVCYRLEKKTSKARPAQSIHNYPVSTFTAS